MKRKFLFIATIVSITAFAGVNTFVNSEKETITDLMQANVEALAGGENGPRCSGPKEHVFLSGYTCRCQNSYSCLDNKGCN